MNRFREKPKEVKAVQYKGFESFTALKEFMGEFFNSRVLFRPGSEELIIPTEQGNRNAYVNDYIVKTEIGDYVPFRPDIFESIYEKVE